MIGILRVLLIEESAADAARVLRRLEKDGYRVEAERVYDAVGMRRAVAGGSWDVVIAAGTAGSFGAPEARVLLEEFGPDLPFVDLSGTNGDAASEGANLTRLAEAVRRELRHAEVRHQHSRVEESLRIALAAAENRERLLETVFRAQTDGVVVVNSAGTVIRTNPVAEAVFGVEAAGHHIRDLGARYLGIDPNKCPVAKAVEGATVTGFEHQINGHVIEISAAPIRDLEGELAGAVGICRDITERKRDEAALRDSEATLRQLCDSALDAIILAGPDGNILLWNPAAERMFGYSAAEVMGRSIHDLLVPPALRARATEAFAAFEVSGTGGFIGKVTEIPAIRRDGSEFPVSLSLGVIPDGTGRKVVGIVRNMSGVLEGRRQVEEANERFSSLARHSRTVVWEVDAAGLYTYTSEMSLPLWGYAPEELTGKLHFYDIHPEAGREEFKRAAFACFEARGEFSGLENAIQRKDGRIVWMSTNGLPVLAPNGDLLGYRGTDSDITESRRAREEREASDARYRRLFHSMRDGLAYCKLITDEHNLPVDFRILEVNAAFERVLGVAGAEGKLISTLLPGFHQRHPEVLEVHSRVVWSGQPESFEIQLPEVDRWLAVATHSFEAGHFLAILEDISVRKQAEIDREAMVGLLGILSAQDATAEMIGKAAEYLRRWLHCDALAVRLGDAHGLPYTQSTGYPRGFAAARQPEFEEICRRVLQRDPGPMQTYFTANGTFRCGRMTDLLPESEPGFGYPSAVLIPLRSAGRIFGLLQMQDRQVGRFSPDRVAWMERAAANFAIAIEQRRTQDALRASEERFRLISENTADVLWLFDAVSGRYEYLSPSVERVLGYTPEEMMAGGLELTLTPETLPQAHARIAEGIAALRSGTTLSTQVHQMEQVRKDGARVLTEVSTALMPGPRDGPCTIVGICRDVTERSQAEARWMQAQKLESVGRLAGGVAHDFNNLLTVINGYSNLLLRELTLGDPARDSVMEIASAGKRAAALTAQLLMLSRKPVQQLRPVNLNEIVIEVQKMLARVIGEHIRIDVVLAPGLGAVLADPGQIHQMLMNLVLNARDAMHGGGILRIDTANVLLDEHCCAGQGIAPGPYIELRVADSGTGIAPGTESHLFEPFFTTKEIGKGTGLGLATVYAIVKQCNGSIAFESQPGRGTTFIICLPRVEAAPAEWERVAPPDAYRGTETVLIVEDQDQLRRMVAQVLMAEGYTVYIASGGRDALHRASLLDGPIHLLLTDVVMPGMSGPELAAQMRPFRPNMKVIFMSGYSEQEWLTPVALQSAAAYLPKPFTPEEVAAAVRQALGPPQASASILVADDESGVRSLLRRILVSAGYSVLEAANGREAERMVATSRVDLLITDLAMPEQEGVETIQRLRRERPSLKIITISGRFAESVLSATEMLGAHASLPKPIDAPKLLSTVGRLLSPGI